MFTNDKLIPIVVCEHDMMSITANMTVVRSSLVVVALLSIACVANSQPALGKYNVDRTKISTSGVSSGAAMATQMHVAFSSLFMGVGLLGGNPYYCSQGSVTQSTGACMLWPERVPVDELVSQTTRWASSGSIDQTNNMYNSRVFVLNGMLDSVVEPGLGQKTMQYYFNFVRQDNIKGVFDLPAAHTFPTVDYGSACNDGRSPYLGKCNYNAAFEMLNHIYGNLERPESPSGAVPGQLIQFNQREFNYNFASMDTSGYIYVPSQCANGAVACRLHVVFHGCRQGRDFIGDEFARYAGYNQVGEKNNIIILYPQVQQSIAAPVNPQGCWDWWGYTNNNYAIKRGQQLDTVHQMVQRVAF